jgi:ABC-type sulfate/molybdate transport systems ATPase subunit
VAVARALASAAPVVVMDEPLAHVDPTRTDKYWAVIRRHVAGRSLVFATHRPAEVLGEAANVIALKAGRVLFAGTAAELYWRPATPELAECLGPVNWLGGRCYRPEQLRVVRDANGPATVVSARFRGSVAEVELEQGGVRQMFWHRPAGDELRPGERVRIETL